MIVFIASHFSLVWGLLAATAYALGGLFGGRLSAQQSRNYLWLISLFHGLSVIASLIPADNELAHFGFAAALSATSWLVLLVYTVEHHWFPQMQTRWLMSGAGMVAVLLPLLFPGHALHSTSSAWLPFHWMLGMASYALFAAAVVHASLMSRAERQMRMGAVDTTGLPLLTLERLTFRFVNIGFLLLSATLLAGWLFGEQLYGPDKALRFDHKTLFAVLAWLVFLLLIWGRRYRGWRGAPAVRTLYAGAALLLLSYAGSRFVTEVFLNRTS
ncbi:MAG: cytochrome C assembly protein [Limnohabitans sp.]|nr:cytochrome C assembly protein [Limnohabitans sp.]